MKVIQEHDTFFLSTTTKGRLSFIGKLPFFDMKNAALGKDYDLSVVFIGNKRCRSLNKKYRNMDKPTDILSFPYDKTSGEIFISIPYSRKKAVEFDRDFENFIGFIFIHGLIHLKGYEHGSRMENEEESLRKKFHI